MINGVSFFYTGCKKGTQAWRGCRTQMSKEVPVNICAETCDCWDTGGVLVISTAHALCDSYAFQHNFQLFVAQKCALSRKFLVSLEFPDRHSVLVALIPLKLLIGVEYTKVFSCPHNQNSRRLKSGDRAGQLIGPPRPSHCSPKVWFRSSLTMRR
jgi:hypothetical protein